MPFPMPPHAEARRSAVPGNSVSTSLADHIVVSHHELPVILTTGLWPPQERLPDTPDDESARRHNITSTKPSHEISVRSPRPSR